MKKKCFAIRSIISMSLLAFVFSAVNAIASTAGEVPIIMGGKKVVLEKIADNFIIMYDSSSSMAAPYMGTSMTKVEAARQILIQKNQALPDLNWEAGIYSHTPGLVPLRHLKTYLPMQTYNKGKFGRYVHALPVNPCGPTLLQGGLVALDEILADLSGRTVVFLFSDGLYTDQRRFASPASIVAGLVDQHDVCFAVISSATSERAIAVVNDIAGINDCSKVINFTDLLDKPERMTDLLYRIREIRVDEPEPKPEEVVVAIAVSNILFDFDKTDIKIEFIVDLNNLVIFMQEHPHTRVILAGHTDSIGTDEYNQELSHQRAGAVRDFLVHGGVDRDRIALHWFGEANPVASNEDEEGRSQNRRVTAVITGLN